MPRLTNVVIVDADEKGREILGYGFAGDGVEVATAPDAPGLDALGRVPDVAVVACRSPADQAIITHLAQTSRWQGVPVLTLVAEADDAVAPESLPNVIPLPAFVRDIITAGKLLAAGGLKVTSEDTVKEVSGSLSDFGLVFIVRTMVGLGWSGIVTVERGDRRGEIRIDSGDVVGATVGSLQGEAALHQLLLWEEAALSLKLRKVAHLDHTFPKGKELLEENERFLRDFSHATKNVGHTHSLFVQDLEKTAELGGNIPAEIVPVLKLFDGHRTLGDALEDSPFRVFDTLRTMTRLLELGALRRKAIERPTVGLKGQLRRPQVEDWVNRRSEPPTVTPRSGSAAPATDPPGALQNRRRRRRRTGEVPQTGGLARQETGRRKSGNHNVVRAAAPGTARPAETGAAAVVAPVAAEGERSGALHARGELEVRAAGFVPVDTTPEGPSVVVALDVGGDAPPANAEPLPPSPGDSPASAAPNGEAHPAPSSNGETHAAGGIGGKKADPGPGGAQAPEPVASPVAEPAQARGPEPTDAREAGAAEPPSAVSAEAEQAGPTEAVPVATGNAGMRSAEIVIAADAPPPTQLSASGTGPSILLDPRLLEEMDAFEMANSPPTPPPVLAAPPPDQAILAPAPVVPAAPAAEKPPQPVEPKPATVVSFVRSEGSGAHANHAALNNAPTVPLSAVQARPADKAPPESPPAAMTPIAQDAVPVKAFDDLEADFFARESELYQNEPTDNFEDLDGARRRR